MKLKILYSFLFISTIICGQNVAINSSGTIADDSAILDISSTSKGLLIPRMTNTQMNNIVSPVEGLVIYNKNQDSFWYYNSSTSSWTELGDNLGNHIADENVQMSGNWLSNDGDSEGIFIRSNGNVGIGEETPTSVLHVDVTNSNVKFENPGTSPDGSSISVVSSTGNPALRIQLGDGSGGATQTWDVRVDDASNDFVIRDVTNTTDRIEVNAITGRVDIGTNGDGSDIRSNSFTTYSDKRFKTNIELITNSLNKLNEINGYTYHWKNSPDTSLQVGVIAQEIEKVLPEIVSTDEEGYKSVDYSKLSALLIEALKEQQKQLAQQKKEISLIEKRLLNIETTLSNNEIYGFIDE